MNGMQDKLLWIEGRYDEITQLMTQPDVAADADRLRRLMQEHAQLEPVLEAYRAWQKLLERDREAD